MPPVETPDRQLIILSGADPYLDTFTRTFKETGSLVIRVVKCSADLLADLTFGWAGMITYLIPDGMDGILLALCGDQ